MDEIMNSDTILANIQSQVNNLARNGRNPLFKSRIEDTKAARFMDVSIQVGDVVAGVTISFTPRGTTINHLPVDENVPSREYATEKAVVDYVVQYFARKTQKLPHAKEEVGHTCGICRRKVEEVSMGRGCEPIYSCSEFCAEVRDKELEEFRNASPGVACNHPCPGCGCIMEYGEWHNKDLEGCCSECAESNRLKKRTEALRKCRDVLEASAFKAKVWDSLRAEIDEALEA